MYPWLHLERRRRRRRRRQAFQITFPSSSPESEKFRNVLDSSDPIWSTQEDQITGLLFLLTTLTTVGKKYFSCGKQTYFAFFPFSENRRIFLKSLVKYFLTFFWQIQASHALHFSTPQKPRCHTRLLSTFLAVFGLVTPGHDSRRPPLPRSRFWRS